MVRLCPNRQPVHTAPLLELHRSLALSLLWPRHRMERIGIKRGCPSAEARRPGSCLGLAAGANFTNAVVDRVAFDKTDLSGANFTNAVITGAPPAALGVHRRCATVGTDATLLCTPAAASLRVRSVFCYALFDRDLRHRCSGHVHA